MKKLILLLAILSYLQTVIGQVDFLRLSPLQRTEIKVGFTDITIENSRPSRKGRVIYGNLVPYDELWRTGANRSTKISFSDTVYIGKTVLAPDTYTLLTKPTKTDWDIYFYKDLSLWEDPDSLDNNKVAAHIKVPSFPLNRSIETLTLTVDDLTKNSVSLGIAWENIYVAIPINIPTDRIMTQDIAKALAQNATDFHAAAYYNFNNNLDLEQAKDWMAKAILIRAQPDYRDYLWQSLILDKLGDRKGAIKSAKQSLAIAKTAGSKYGVKENQQTLKEWGVQLAE